MHISLPNLSAPDTRTKYVIKFLMPF